MHQILCWGFVISGIALPVSAGVQYTINDLGTLGGATSFAYAINASGQVVGGSLTAAGSEHAFLYSDGNMLDLGTLGGGSSVAYGINDSGLAVGDSDVGAVAHAFLYDGSRMDDLTPTSGFSSARAINSAGQVAGSIDNPQGTTAFISTNGSLLELGALPGDTWSRAYGINASGRVAGLSWNSNDPASAIHAFASGGGGIVNIDSASPFDTFANAINANGDIVGEASGRAFLFGNSTLTDLGTLGGDVSDAYGINAAGFVVGSSDTVDDSVDAFLYSNGSMVDLNTLIDASQGWHLEFATAINDAGQIVGYGTGPATGDNVHAFLLTPLSGMSAAPEPGGVAVFAGGLAFVVRRRRGQRYACRSGSV